MKDQMNKKNIYIYFNEYSKRSYIKYFYLNNLLTKKIYIKIKKKYLYIYIFL